MRKPWSAHVFYVCDLSGEQCGDNAPYGEHGHGGCEGCDYMDGREPMPFPCIHCSYDNCMDCTKDMRDALHEWRKKNE